MLFKFTKAVQLLQGGMRKIISQSGHVRVMCRLLNAEVTKPNFQLLLRGVSKCTGAHTVFASSQDNLGDIAA